ncbi:MAG: PIN domain-containing protein, partial [Halobacteriota archaeon]
RVTKPIVLIRKLTSGLQKQRIETLEKHKNSLILTDQVWMEFLKNRQKVILEGMKQIAKPHSASIPSLMNEFQATKTFLKLQKDAIKQHAKVIRTVEKILKRPADGDIVYKSLSRIFGTDSDLNLKRPNKKRYEVRRLARQRFALGYPPRKDDSLRFGDAINWEWIINCAKSSKNKSNIVIVSRDYDYGLTDDSEGFLNDWLRLEFKERVSQQRKIELTNRLSNALKKLDVNVASKDLDEENRILREPPTWEAMSEANLKRQYELLQQTLREKLFEFQDKPKDQK